MGKVPAIGVFLLTSLAFEGVVWAKNQVIVISGGDNPGLNHYSQYLQTKNLYHHALDKFGSSNVGIYFGAGNQTVSQDAVNDVHKIQEYEQQKIHVMLPGIFKNNHEASKEEVKIFFSQVNLNEGDNLYVFVSDHGMPNLFLEDKSADKFSDNCIDLWNYNRDFTSNFDNKENFSKVCLSKNEFKNTLTAVVKPHKYTIFQMSQCYSGGFHQMSVTQENGYPKANPAICGFTSAPPDHFASGCTADANGKTYQGYERYFTEWYTGIDVVTGKMLREPSPNLLEAHENALLQDLTVDIPLSTSDYYLWEWARTIESKSFRSRLKRVPTAAVRFTYENYKDYTPHVNDNSYLAFKMVLKRNTVDILKQYPEHLHFGQLPLKGKKKYILGLEKEIAEKEKLFSENQNKQLKIYKEKIQPYWEKELASGDVTTLSAEQYKMEDEFYGRIAQKNLLLVPYQFEMFFLQYLSMNNSDPALSQYYNSRNAIIKTWAVKNKQDEAHNAIESYINLQDESKILQERLEILIRKKQLLRRIYIYNQVLAAWTTLIKIHDKNALEELNGLIKCQKS